MESTGLDHYFRTDIRDFPNIGCSSGHVPAYREIYALGQQKDRDTTPIAGLGFKLNTTIKCSRSRQSIWRLLEHYYESPYDDRIVCCDSLSFD